MTKKILTALIAIVLLSGAGFYANKFQTKLKDKQGLINLENQIDTKDWKTAINEGWGYSIKYPPYLFVKYNTQGDKFPGDTEGDERFTKESPPYDGGQTLIISDKEKMGIQDIMPDEKIHLEINTERYQNKEPLKDFVKNRHGSLTNGIDDGNKKLVYTELKNESDEYIFRYHSEVKKWPYDGVWKDKSLIFNNNCRYIIKNGFLYSVCGGTTNFLMDKGIDDNFDIVKKMIESFSFNNQE